jgi:hypothetical protein
MQHGSKAAPPSARVLWHRRQLHKAAGSAGAARRQPHPLEQLLAPLARRLPAKLLQAQRLAQRLGGLDVAQHPLGGPLAAGIVRGVPGAPLGMGASVGARGTRLQARNAGRVQPMLWPRLPPTPQERSCNAAGAAVIGQAEGTSRGAAITGTPGASPPAWSPREPSLGAWKGAVPLSHPIRSCPHLLGVQVDAHKVEVGRRAVGGPVQAVGLPGGAACGMD